MVDTLRTLLFYLLWISPSGLTEGEVQCTMQRAAEMRACATTGERNP